MTPLRINGSAIETLFSQIKHGSGGTLMASSYSSVCAKLITKRTIHGTHVGDPYRDAPLYIRETDLPTKKPKKIIKLILIIIQIHALILSILSS